MATDKKHILQSAKMLLKGILGKFNIHNLDKKTIGELVDQSHDIAVLLHGKNLDTETLDSAQHFLQSLLGTRDIRTLDKAEVAELIGHAIDLAKELHKKIK